MQVKLPGQFCVLLGHGLDEGRRLRLSWRVICLFVLMAVGSVHGSRALLRVLHLILAGLQRRRRLVLQLVRGVQHFRLDVNVGRRIEGLVVGAVADRGEAAFVAHGALHAEGLGLRTTLGGSHLVPVVAPGGAQLVVLGLQPADTHEAVPVIAAVLLLPAHSDALLEFLYVLLELLEVPGEVRQDLRVR